MDRAGERWIGRAGVAAGVLAVGAFVLGAGAPQKPPPTGLELTMSANLTGELDVMPHGRPFLAADGLRPGERRTGAITVTNITTERQLVRLRVSEQGPGATDLDDAIAIDVKADGVQGFADSLGGLRRWSSPGMSVAPGRTLKLRFSVVLRPTQAAYDGRSESLLMELKS